MKKISLVFAAALALAATGCKKHGADCGKALDKSMELAKADMQKRPGMDDNAIQKLKDLGLQHCKDDKWPEDVLQCMADAKTETDAQACYGKLSRDQQDTMNKAMMAAMMPAGGAGSAGSDTGSAMGSDIGSAGAGGAMSASGSAGSAAAPK